MSQNPSPKTKKYRGGGNNLKEDGRSWLRPRQGRAVHRQLPVQFRFCIDVWFYWDYRTGRLPEQSPGWGGKGDQGKNQGRSREVDTMKVRCRRTRSRGSVSTTTTTNTTMTITTCTADRAESLLQDMKEYVPDLIPATEVLNLLLRCYSNCSGPPRPGEGGDGGG